MSVPTAGVFFRPDGVNDLFGDDKYCSEDTSKGVKFSKTRCGLTAEVPCPNPEKITGTVTRYCNCEDLKWGTVITINCVHKWVSDVQRALEREDPAENVSYQLAMNLGETLPNALYGGDISGSVALSSGVLDLARRQYQPMDRNERNERANSFTQNLGDSGDHLLAPKAASVWREFDPTTRIEHASTLMSVLEQSALLLADYSLNPNRTFNYQNWAMKYEVKPPQDKMYSQANAAAAPLDDSIPATIRTQNSQQHTEFRSSVSFSEFSNSPILSLPTASVLQTSSMNSHSGGSMHSPTIQLNSADPSTTGEKMESAPNLNRTTLKLGYYIFNTFADLLSDSDNVIINSNIAGASVDDATRSLQLPVDQPATFTFFHIRRSGVSNPRCVYWNTTERKWLADGCTLLSTNHTSSQCACDHLTSFAILMDVSGRLGRNSGELSAALDVVSTIGCALSIVCLVLSLAVFTLFRGLYSVRNTIHRNLCFCLLVAELVFVIGMDRTGNATGCSVVALLLHYFFLSSFCWMLLEGYQLYMMLIQVFEPSKTHILLYYLFCYGFPGVVVAVSAGTAWQNYGTDQYCWINTSTPTIWAFVVPIIIVIIANLVFLGIALKVVLSVRSRERTTGDRVVGWLKGSATLLCLLGVTWIFGFLTAVNGSGGVVFAWIFTILNCTQGIFIFVLHVVMNDKVRSAVVRWLRSGVCCLPDSSSAYNSKSFLSSRQRIMNMVKSHSRSDPSTASTDDKERQLTPNSKTSAWLRRISEMRDNGESMQSEKSNSEIDRKISFDMEGTRPIIEVDRMSADSDPRGSQVLESEAFERSTVKRKKFPLGLSENERGSTHRNSVLVERF